MDNVANVLLRFEQRSSLATVKFSFMHSCNLNNSQVNLFFDEFYDLAPQSTCK